MKHLIFLLTFEYDIMSMRYLVHCPSSLPNGMGSSSSLDDQLIFSFTFLPLESYENIYDQRIKIGFLVFYTYIYRVPSHINPSIVFIITLLIYNLLPFIHLYVSSGLWYSKNSMNLISLSRNTPISFSTVTLPLKSILKIVGTFFKKGNNFCNVSFP